MEWVTKLSPNPQFGDIRTRKVFAWVPKDCVDGKTRWLTSVVHRELYGYVREMATGWKLLQVYPYIGLCSCGSLLFNKDPNHTLNACVT